MPTTRRSRVLPSPPDRVWRVIGDPHHLPRWWPKVRRVEAVSGERFTQVMRTEKGKDVRADFRIVEEEPERLLRFEQELEGTPFEGFLSESATAIEAEPSGDGTKVFMTQRGRPVRADYELVESERGRRMRWRQEVEDSPFERVLDESVTEVRVAPAGPGTEVTLELRQNLRGMARLGPFLVRRGARRLLDEALEGLERCTAR